MKDFEKQMSALTLLKEQKDRLEEELKVSRHTLHFSLPSLESAPICRRPMLSLTNSKNRCVFVMLFSSNTLQDL